MRNLFLLLLFLPSIAQAHPGVGIVKDSKGTIYFTDLHQVWKIINGKKSVAVPNVHTHELYVDKNDNLYGEGGYYDDKAVKFYHYMWVLRTNGQIDTVIGMKEQYVHQDFSLARDRKGNEYYLKRFLIPHTDTNHIYRKSPDGKETILATGNFKNVNWLHPQDDGSLLYVSKNAIYRVDNHGNIRLVKTYIKNTKTSNAGNDIQIWGIWQDNAKNVYAAVMSDKTVKKVDSSGNITIVYQSKENWAPLHGVFDNDNKLWVLEGSDKNEVRVAVSETFPVKTSSSDKSKPDLLLMIILSSFILSFIVLYLKFRNSNRRLKLFEN